MKIEAVPLLTVQARWGYTEIVDGTNSQHYDNGANVEELRAKRRLGLPFSDLSPEEQYNLALLCVSVRANMFVFTVGVEHLAEIALERTIIGKLLVPQMASGIPGFMSFEDFMQTTHPDPKDARNVVLRSGGYTAPTDPLTIGRLFGSPILMDGYHRAALSWKFGPADDRLPAYVPLQFIDVQPNQPSA